MSHHVVPDPWVAPGTAVLIDGNALDDVVVKDFSFEASASEPLYARDQTLFRYEQRAAFTVSLPQASFALLTGLADTFSPPRATLTQTIDLNPNHRRVRSLRELWKQVRDIVKWEYNKAAGNPQPETRTITIPDLEWRPAS